MNSQEFQEFGKSAIDYIANYIETIRDRPVLPSVEPGYLQHMIPNHVPEKPEKWQDVMSDMERVIMPGITHWSSPHFHAYYPTANSYPAVVGELLSAGIGVIGFSWITSPACTELEVVVMDWLGKLIGLPSSFLKSSQGTGGGIIQGSASEATLVCLLAAKNKTLTHVSKQEPEWDEGTIKGKMVAYSSDQSNSSVEKAGLLSSVKMRLLPSDKNGSLKGETLLAAIQEDLEKGLIPIYVCATLGTTGTCSFDKLDEIGPICKEYNLWLHVDAAYAGSAFICPEYRYLMKGVECADSFSLNPHKWLLVNFDCSALWVKNSTSLVKAFNVDRIYLKHQKEGMSCAPDYRHWQIPLGRRFRSLKLWITLRLYGSEQLQEYIRKQVKLAKMFQQLVMNDNRFELVMEPKMAVVCFKLKGPDSLTRTLLDRITARKQIYVIAGSFDDKLNIRFVICSRLCEEKDVLFAWKEIESQADMVFSRKEHTDMFDKVESPRHVQDVSMIDFITEKDVIMNKYTDDIRFIEA